MGNEKPRCSCARVEKKCFVYRNGPSVIFFPFSEKSVYASHAVATLHYTARAQRVVCVEKTMERETKSSFFCFVSSNRMNEEDQKNNEIYAIYIYMGTAA